MSKFDKPQKKDDAEFDLNDVSYTDLIQWLNGNKLKEVFKDKYSEDFLDAIEREIETLTKKNK